VVEIEVFYRESRYRQSQGHEIGEVRSNNPGKISAVRLGRQVSEIRRESGYSASGNRSSRCSENGNITSPGTLEELGPSI
jgi:hypothetical protein